MAKKHIKPVVASMTGEPGPGEALGGIEYAAESKPLPGYTEVRLLRNHTHAGTDHDAGETITVSGRTARWLIENGIGTDAEGNQEESTK